MERLSAFTARLRTADHFSVAKVFQAAALGSTLDGYEAEVCQEAARAAGRPDEQKLTIPWSALRQTRDMGAQSDSAGRSLVGTDVASPVDILRPFSTVIQAGITVLPDLSADTALTRTSATSTVSWLSSETASASPSTPTLASTTMTPKVGIGAIQTSRHFLKQFAIAESWLRRELIRTAAGVIDDAVLKGAGSSGEPKGVVNTTGLSTQTGTSLAWAGVLTMKRKAADANAQDGTIGYIGTTAVRELLEGRVRESGGGTYIWEGNSIASCPAYASTLMPSATLLSGPFSMCHLGLWGGITIDANPYDPTLFRTGVVQWRVIIACDVALGCDPTAFTKATSIT